MESERDGQAQDLKVMVVDDDVVFLRYLEAQLKMIGYQTVTVESGVAAWILLQADPPDLVLLDIFMPGMGGLELCRKIKTTPALKDIPVVLLTMMGAKAKDGGYQAGADDFLNKPPHLLELKTRIRNLLLLRQLRAALPPEAEDPPVEVVPGAPPRILIMDALGIPNSHMANTLAEEGWEVQVMRSQEHLLASLRNQRPDLLIIDQDLSDGSGSGLVSRLRSEVGTADLTILLACEAGALELQVGIYQSEADEHLVKPFEPSELKARVRSLLKRSELRSRQDGKVLAVDPNEVEDARGGTFSRAFFLASLKHTCAFAAVVGRPVGLLAYRLPVGAVTGGIRIPEVIKGQLEPHEVLCRVAEGLFVAILPCADLIELGRRVEALKPLLPAGQFATASGKGRIANTLVKSIWDQFHGLDQAGQG